MANDNTLIIRINGTAKDFLDEIDKVNKKTKDLQKVLDKTAKASAIAFAAFATAIGGVTKAFVDYETALVGVGKTTNIEGKRLDAFGKKFQQMSSEIPIATNELLGIAQAAGQLGVEGEENLLKFTDTIAKLGVATDLSGEEAATALTRILNVTKEGIGTIDTFGSVIVALGNNFAATESEIVRMATEVSRSTAVFGVSAAQSAALGTALRSVGVQAQLGGSVVGKAMLSMQKAISSGGASLSTLSQLTGMTGEQFKKAFEEDAAGAFQLFLQGLGNLEGGTSAIFTALESLGLKGDEVNKVLPVLAKNSELVGESFKTAADEVKNATALNKEAEKAFATLGSEFQRLQNNAVNAAANIGEKLAPQITELLKGLNELVASIANADDETLSMIATFLKWGAIVTGAIGSLAAAVKGFLAMKAVIVGAKVAVVAIGGALLTLLGPVGAITVGIAGLVAAVAALTGDDKKLSDLGLDEINKKLEKERELLEYNKKVAEETGKGADNSVAVKQIQDRIDKLEELKKKQEEVRDETRKPLIFEKPDATDEILAPKIAGLDQEQVVPFKTAEDKETSAKEIENLKKKEKEKTELIDAATQERLEGIKRENENLLAIQAARHAGASEAEIAYLQRSQEIQDEFLAAEKIQNEQEREATIENLALKHEKELAMIADFEARKDEEDAIRREERAALNEELQALDDEQRALLNEQELANLQTQFETKKEIEKKFAQDQLKKRAKDRNQYLQDEIKFGTTYAEIQAFFRKSEVQGTKEATGQLVALTNSKNSTLKGIGKAAARVNAAIATAEGAIKAYSSLAGIPIVGPALGAAAAAALTAYGVEQQANISKMQTGGFVPNAIGGARDRVPALLEPNELVVPASVAPNFIQAAGIPDTQSEKAVGDLTESDTPVVEIVLQERASEFISLEQREGSALGTIGDR